MEDITIERSISGMVGKGSLTHNCRAFKAENVKAEYTHNNIEYCNKNIKEVYHELFDKALERYNAKQTRSDRKIENYYEKIRLGKQEKLFHEVIFQIGNKDDMNAQSEDGELAKQILDEFMKSFQQRNPNLRVFSAHLHMDEETPHLHIDFVPFTTGSKRGMDTRVSLKQALAAQGFKGGTKKETEWNQWMTAEKSELAEIMEQHDVLWRQLGTQRKHLSVLDFEKQEREKEIQILTFQKEEISQSIEEMQEEMVEEAQDLKQLQGRKKEIQQEISNLATHKKTTEKSIRMIQEDPVWQLPEPVTLITAKNYRDKKAEPLLRKVKDALIAALVKNVQLNNLVDKIKQQKERLQGEVKNLEQRLFSMEEELVSLQGKARDFGYVTDALGEQAVRDIVEQRTVADVPTNVPQSYRKGEVER